MVRTHTPGTLLIWPGVAEELLGGKARFVRAGVFKDVDATIFSHVSSQLATSWGRPNGTGMVSVEYTFEGESAHAAVATWRGRSALDGATAMRSEEHTSDLQSLMRLSYAVLCLIKKIQRLHVNHS